ncbi:MAG: hypothetical protein ACP5UT_18575 [Bryobacteraceae bacterium]
MEIRLFGLPNAKPVHTDAAGHFRIDGLPPGRYGLMVAPWSGYRAPEIPVDLRFRPRIEGLVIPLRPSCRIAGRVRDHDGKGVPGLVVSALRDPGRETWKAPDRAMAAVTDAQGNFQMEGLDSGSYLLLAEPPMPQWKPRFWNDDDPLPEPMRLPVPTFYPGVDDRTLAAVISLATGEQRGGLEWELAQERTYCLQGLGAVEEKLRLELTRELYLGSASIAKAEIAAGQRWEVCGLPPGRYILAAVRERSSPPPLFSLDSVEITDRSLRWKSWNFRLPFLQKVSVRVKEAQPQPVLEFPSPLVVWLEPSGRPIFEFESEKLLLRITKPGLYDLGPTAGGPSRLHFRTPAGYYLASASISGADVLRNEFHPGEAPLELALARDAAELAVQAVDDRDRPAAFASILLGRDPFPDTPSAVDLFFTEADQDGTAVLTSIPPGAYRIVCLAPGSANLVNAAAMFRASLNNGERLELSHGSRRSVRAVIRSVQP